jgi:hypothetical protein
LDGFLAAFIDLLRNEKLVHFLYDLTTRPKSEAFPPPFLVVHCASATASSKPISFQRKSQKQ